MALEEIERLKEKISKDPNSKLFVPLAEEYKKAGMFDEAIDALTQGLERQPNYLSARVSLGKIYIERGMLAEARTEFEQVIAAIPDNLYAHKKLAEIYLDLGERQNAIKEFKTVLQLHPLDEWASASLSTIEQGPEIPAQNPAAEIFPTEPAHLKMAEGVDLSQVPYEAIKQQGLQPEAEPPVSEEVEEDLWMESSETLMKLGEEQADISGLPADEETAVLLKDEPELHTDIKEKAVSISEEDLAIWKSHARTLETIEEGEQIIEAEAIPGEESLSFEGVAEESKITAASARETSAQPALGIGDADSFIAQGRYNEAMNVYKKLLSQNPGNNKVMQRIEELRTLLKLLGKDKQELITTLENFLEAIKKRRNEFSRRA